MLRKPTAPDDRPVLVVSDSFDPMPEVEALRFLQLSDWRSALIDVAGQGEAPTLAMADMTVLGIFVTADEAHAFREGSDLRALADAAQIPVIELQAIPGADTVMSHAVALLGDRCATLQREAADERAANAELRQLHMAMQRDFKELEDWVHDALAPKYKLARAWPVTGDSIRLGGEIKELRQPLPVPARGTVAVDVNLLGGAPSDGILSMELVRPIGGRLTEAVDVPVAAGQHGWIRLTLPAAPGGEPEDAVACLRYAGDGALDLSLAPPSPFREYDVEATGGTGPGRPLAIRVYRLLANMRPPPVHDPRFPLPAGGRTRFIQPGDLESPEQLRYFEGKVRRALRAYPDRTEVAYWPDEDAILVHPSRHRPVVARVSGAAVERLRQVTALIHLRRHDTMTVAFAIGAAPAGSVNSVEAAQAHLGPWLHLLPSEWGEVWCELSEPLTGPVDLLLATAMPNMPFNRNADAMFRGFRLTTDAA